MTQNIVSLIDLDQSKKWQEILSDLITDPKELVQLLQLDPSSQPPSLAATDQFPLKVTKSFVAAMELETGKILCCVRFGHQSSKRPKSQDLFQIH